MAICAAREGVSPVTYWHTRTPLEFQAAVLAWVETYATPARMFFGARKDAGAGAAPRMGTAGGRNGTRTTGTAPARSRDATYQRLIQTARASGTPLRGNVRTNIVDLAEAMPMDRKLTPEERHRLRLSFGSSFKRDAPAPLSRP